MKNGCMREGEKRETARMSGHEQEGKSPDVGSPTGTLNASVSLDLLGTCCPKTAEIFLFHCPTQPFIFHYSTF